MAKIDIEKEEIIEDESKVVSSKKESKEKTEFRALIEKYKEQNPVKYALKKVELEKKLNAMQ